MPHILADRVKETTTTTGTGPLTLGGALSGFQGFSSVCSVGATIYYALAQVDGSGNPTGVWETGIGTYSSANTLTRTTVFASSNAGAAVSLAAGTTQVWGDAPSSLLGQAAPAGNNDGFVDGALDSWQVGTNFNLSGNVDTYTADMWIHNAGTGGAATVSQVAAPLTGYNILNSPIYPSFLKLHAQTTGSSTAGSIGQKLEGVRTYAGQSVSLAASLYVTAGTQTLAQVRITQNFGTGGSPSAAVVTTKTIAWVLNNGPTRYGVRLDIPSIAGKTLGTNGDDNLRIDVMLPTGVTFSLVDSQWQLVPCRADASSDTAGNGGITVPFEHRGPEAELGRVQRHVKRYSATGAVYGLGFCYSAAQYFGNLPFPVTMRRVPSCSVVGTAVLGNGVTTTSVTCQGESTESATVVFATATGQTIGFATFWGFNAVPTNYIIADARL